MADIKTHLRELSVAVAIGCIKNNIPFEATSTPSQFINIARNTVSNNIDSANNILSLSHFDREHINIIENGFELGKYIFEKFNIAPHDRIRWYGNDTQKDDPVDLSVGTHRFSLKESSFILENMGLYKFISLLTNQYYKRGLHVFEEFAKYEYNNWFAYTWERLLDVGSWSKRYLKYTSSFVVDGNYVYFNFNDESICKVPTTINTPTQFMEYTNAKVREKVFSKWISECLKRDAEYLRLKKICSETAGNSMCVLIIKNLNPQNLGRLLQLREFEYYYAKSTLIELKVLKVPSIYDFTYEIVIDNIRYEVPESQLNIITTIKNSITHNTFTIRNECRFSHGQFNGTPEAKMYYERDGDLSIIYTQI